MQIFRFTTDIKNTMETFTLSGHFNSDRSRKFNITLPRAKHFDMKYILDGEQDLQIHKLVKKAVNRYFIRSHHKNPNVEIPGEEKLNPMYSSAFSKVIYNTDVPRTLRKILQKNPYPLSQGPVIPFLDSATEEEKSEVEIMEAKTIFTHEESQKCFAWHPKESEISLWCQNGYQVSQTEFKIHGAASSLDKKLLYTCSFFKCVIYCPCSLCRGENQCGEHFLLLPRLFDVETDHFTIITDKIDQYRHAIAHAGIPLNCNSCTKDVKEHQALHLVLHNRCKFCKHELRPLEKNPMTTFKHYEKAAQFIISEDNRTCSYCFLTCSDIYERKKHEALQHENKEKKYKCENCENTFSNINALTYHKKTKHEEVTSKHTCDTCGSQFSCEETLSKHRKVLHNDHPSMETCNYCGKTFNTISNLYRHKKEKHWEINANLAYNTQSSLIECKHCDVKFTRAETMKRHVENIHSGKRKTFFKCAECDIQFSRKDNHARHMRSKHKSD